MEWNELDLVQEFTVEGQCSKIKVRSCRITWDSLQVIPARGGGGLRRCMLVSAGGAPESWGQMAGMHAFMSACHLWVGDHTGTTTDR